jgi:RNA polymerase sigma-70 factor (ECF subfamily)
MVGQLVAGIEALAKQEGDRTTAVPSDEQLALGIQRGRRDDLALLVQRYHSPLLGYLYRLCGGDRAQAEDLAQESFLRALQAIGQYRHPQPFKPWLYAIATNLARDYYKRAETRYTEAADEEASEVWRSTAPSPAELALAEDTARQVAMALTALPGQQREAVILRYYQGLSLQEIGGVLQIPVGTVKSRLSIGLKRLKEMLAE